MKNNYRAKYSFTYSVNKLKEKKSLQEKELFTSTPCLTEQK